MTSGFDHEDLRVYQAAIAFVAWHEDVALAATSNASAWDHLSRASAGVPVNIAQASGKRSMNDRRQFIDTAYGSALECAACLDVLGILRYLKSSTVQDGKMHLSRLVSMLIGFRKSTDREIREDRAEYLTNSHSQKHIWFDHEKLDVYVSALGFVDWCGRTENNVNISLSTKAALDRTSTGIALNIAEGNGKFSKKDRCRFISHARTAALQAAATLDIHATRKARNTNIVAAGKNQLVDIVRMLVAWERSLLED
jgi:four helix bundle protein